MKRLSYIISPIAFIALSFWLLLHVRPYILETAALTPFLTTQLFASTMLSAPCGLLFYVASFMQSCFALPFVGISLFVLVLSLQAVVLWRACHIDYSLFPSCWLPSFLLLLNYSQAGYLIFVLKTPALAFTLPVGLLVAVLMFWAWRAAASRWQLVLLAVAYLAVGYWTIGVCYFVAVAMIVLFEVCQTIRFHRYQRLFAALALAMLSAILPLVLYRLGPVFVNISNLYTIGLPDFSTDSAEAPLLWPYRLAIAVVLLLPMLRNIGKPRLMAVVTLLMFAVCATLTYARTYRDANFLSALRMKQAISSACYEDVLTEARQIEGEPTRLQVLLCRLSLLRLGRLADECFVYPDGCADYNCPRDVQLLQKVGGRLIYYHFGLPNYAFRWAMEDFVEYGPRPDYLSMMRKCSLLNGETTVASKYADALECVPFAESDDVPQSELDAIRQIMPSADVMAEDDGVVEGFLLNTHASISEGSKAALELSIVCNLIRKNSDAFWPLFEKWWQQCDDNRIPTHFQEACLLFGQMYGVDTTLLPLSDDVKQSFSDFLAQVRQNANDDYSRTALRPMFGHTYWYYYFYRDNLTTY